MMRNAFHDYHATGSQTQRESFTILWSTLLIHFFFFLRKSSPIFITQFLLGKPFWNKQALYGIQAYPLVKRKWGMH